MKILSKLIEYGLIKEFNDWERHFLAGTQGVPKTDAVIVNYVKALLEDVFENQTEKIKRCKLAPWLISVVQSIGPENIDTAQRNKIIDVINWFKISGTEGPFKNRDLESAHEFVVSKKVKEKSVSPKEEDESGQYLQAEKDGRIKRVGSVGDGRIWVEVIDPTWLGEEGELNPHHKWGVNCQNTSAHGFWSSSMLNVQLIGPPHGNPKGKWSTHLAIAGPRGTGEIKELKQEGNQQPGIVRTSGGYSDGAEVVVNFLCSNSFAKQNFNKFTTYQGEVPTRVMHNTFGGDTFLIYLAKPNTAELFNKLMDCREDILENNRDLIISIKGLEWFEERNINVNDLVERDPKEFLRRFDRLFNRFGKVATDALKKIDFEDILNEDKDLFMSSLPFLIGRIPPNDFITLVKMIDLKEFMVSKPEDFKSIIKLMSNDKAFSGLLQEIYNMDPEYFFSVFGKGINGVIKFIKFASTPRLREHQDAIWDPKKEQYYKMKDAYKYNPDGTIMRDSENNRIVDYTYKSYIKDELLVMNKSQRQKFLEKNEDFIKSLIKGDDFAKKLTYLKLVLPQMSEQEAKKILNTDNLKEKIIKYFDQKYLQYKEDENKGEEFLINKYGRRLQGAGSAPVLQAPKPGILEFKDQFPIGNVESRKIPKEDIFGNFNRLLNFYANKSLKADIDNMPKDPNKAENLKKVEAWKGSHKIKGYAEVLKLMKDNGVPEEELMKIIDGSAKTGELKTPLAAYQFFSQTLGLLRKSKAILEAQKLKSFFSKYGTWGDQYYTDLIKKLSTLTFNVKPGDRIEFKGNEANGQKYRLTRGKLYLVMEVKNVYKDELSEDQMEDISNIESINGEVMVTEDDFGVGYGGQNIWVPTDRFKVSYDYKLISEKLNESFNDFSEKFRRLKDTLSEIENSAKPKYTAVMLDDNSMKKLHSLIDQLKKTGEIGDDWKISADHVTINMGGAKDNLILGHQVNITADALGSDNMVAALKVSVDKNLDFQGRTPHITLAFNKIGGGKPVMSNNLKEWKKITPLSLRGTIDQVY